MMAQMHLTLMTLNKRGSRTRFFIVVFALLIGNSSITLAQQSTDSIQQPRFKNKATPLRGCRLITLKKSFNKLPFK